MELFRDLYFGFSVAFLPINLFFCFLGVSLGTLVGVLPGLGPAATIALLLPITYKMQPETAIIMLAGIYYGAQYGGSITSILLNIPGEASTAITCLDGYQMARQGKAGRALGISAFGSFIGGTISIVGLMILGPFLAIFALRLGPPEYLGLTFLAIVILTFLSHESMVKSLISSAAGFFLGTIGIDIVYGTQRFTFGTLTLMDGVGLVPVAMGLFGIAEVLTNLEQKHNRDIYKAEIKGLLPNRKDWVESIWPIIRGSVIGFFLGIIPGGGAIMASFTSYAVEKRLSRNPKSFGQGAIAGVAGPETANNAAAGGAMIPLLCLGIPANVIMALFLGALLLHGIKPSVFLVNEHPQIFWGLIASMYVGNVFLLILNLPMIGIWVRILKISYSILFPLILLFCLIGVYTINSNVYEVLIMLIFGALGYLMRKTGFDPTSLLFAMIIGPIMETALRQCVLESRGDLSILFTRPISAVIFSMGFLLLLLLLVPRLRRKRETFTKELSDE